MVKITLFSQIVKLLPRNKFDSLVSKYNTDKGTKGISSWAHFISMMFCHIGHAGSVRDISNGLRSITGNINHLGFNRVPCKSSMSYINQHRDWRLFRDFFQEVLVHLQNQTDFKRSKLLRLRRKVFLIDASVIPLCLSMFDWAKFRKRKGAVKLHLVLDYDGCLPVFATVTDGKTHEINMARQTEFPSGSVLVFDRGYIDFLWMKELDSRKIFFVTRAKTGMDYEVLESYEIPEKATGKVLEDIDIRLTTPQSSDKYPGKLRLVRYWDEENQKELVFLTNNRSWTAQMVADIYKERWNIEVFFKHIKQNLKIKTFIGTSLNAVMIQIWTALITMLLLTFLKVKAQYQWHLSNLITFIRLNLFVKIDLFEWINHPFYKDKEINDGQLLLFDG